MKLNPFIIEKTENSNQFLLRVNDGGHFLIGQTTKSIFDIIKVDSYSRENLINEIENKKLIETSRNDLEILIDTNIIPMLVEKPSKKSIKKIFTVFKPKNLEFVMKRLLFLFNKQFFYPLLFILGIINTLYFFSINLSISQTTTNLITPITMGIILSVIIHELGHATAAYNYNIMSKEVGFCIYFIFPAFYTDMNSLWKLGRKKRVVANLGGIYFQLMINIFLILLILTNKLSSNTIYILHSIITSNILICLYNLNPFFKFDGYWIFSDITGIINLKEKSNTVISNFLKLSKPAIKPSPTLLIYSIVKMVFMGYIYFKITIWGGTSIKSAIVHINSANNSYDIKLLLLALASIGILSILCITIFNFIKSNFYGR